MNETFLLPVFFSAMIWFVHSRTMCPKKFPTPFVECSVFTKIDAIAVPKPVSFRENSTRNFFFVNLARLFCECFVENGKFSIFLSNFIDSVKRIFAEFFCISMHANFAPVHAVFAPDAKFYSTRHILLRILPDFFAQIRCCGDKNTRLPSGQAGIF
ncbi:hypothetical protein [Butyricicoccus sp.]|uniref:hypothetical protein n=1 Tax=Butyricicoccus sp. TaxID=2049021 RepID=UPI003D7CF8C2